MNQFGSGNVFPMMTGNQGMFAGVPRPPHFGQPNPGSLPFNPQMAAQMANRACMPGPMGPGMVGHQPSAPQASVMSNVGQKTNASDLYSRQSRIYVGSVSPKLSREQLISIFSKYGKVTGLSHLKGHEKGYAFVQYDNPTSAKAAVARENHKFHSGLAFEINVVSDEKKISQSGSSGLGGKGRGSALSLQQNTSRIGSARQNSANMGSIGGPNQRHVGPSGEGAVSNLKRIAVSSTKTIQPPTKKFAAGAVSRQPMQQKGPKPNVPPTDNRLNVVQKPSPQKVVKTEEKQKPSSRSPAIPDTTRTAPAASTRDLLVCGHCHSVFSDLTSFQGHKASLCERIPDVLWCFSCNQIFTSAWLLLKHAQSEHNIQVFKTKTSSDCEPRPISSDLGMEKSGVTDVGGSFEESFELEATTQPNGERLCSDKFNRHPRSEEDTNDSTIDKPESNDGEQPNLADDDSNPLGQTSPGGMEEDILLAVKDDICDV